MGLRLQKVLRTKGITERIYAKQLMPKEIKRYRGVKLKFTTVAACMLFFKPEKILLLFIYFGKINGYRKIMNRNIKNIKNS